MRRGGSYLFRFRFVVFFLGLVSFMLNIANCKHSQPTQPHPRPLAHASRASNLNWWAV